MKKITAEELSNLSSEKLIKMIVELQDDLSRTKKYGLVWDREKNTEEVQLEEWDSVKPARQKVENKPRSSSFKKIVDYFWNGQEMDF